MSAVRGSHTKNHTIKVRLKSGQLSTQFPLRTGRLADWAHDSRKGVGNGRKIVSIDARGVKWSEFKADGFQRPVPGIIYESGESECGLPLGGIGTGCIDLDTDGTFGRCSIFNSFAPPRVLNTPFLGLTLGNEVYCLSTRPPRESTPRSRFIIGAIIRLPIWSLRLTILFLSGFVPGVPLPRVTPTYRIRLGSVLRFVSGISPTKR